MTPHADDVQKILGKSSVPPCPPSVHRYLVTLHHDHVESGLRLRVDVLVDISNAPNGAGPSAETVEDAARAELRTKLQAWFPPLADLSFDYDVDWDIDEYDVNESEITEWYTQYGDTHDPDTGAPYEEEDLDDDNEEEEDSEDGCHDDLWDDYDSDDDDEDFDDESDDDDDDEAPDAEWRRRFNL